LFSIPIPPHQSPSKAQTEGGAENPCEISKYDENNVYTQPACLFMVYLTKNQRCGLEHTRKKRKSIKADQSITVTGMVKGTLVLAPQPPDLGG